MRSNVADGGDGVFSIAMSRLPRAARLGISLSVLIFVAAVLLFVVFPSGQSTAVAAATTKLGSRADKGTLRVLITRAWGNGELVLIQRTPKWSEFLPGAAVSDDTAQTTASEKKSISDRGLKLFFAIDPTDGATGRDRLADLPSPLFGQNFGSLASLGAQIRGRHHGVRQTAGQCGGCIERFSQRKHRICTDVPDPGWQQPT